MVGFADNGALFRSSRYSGAGSRDDLHSFGYDTPHLTKGSGSYTTLMDATNSAGAIPQTQRLFASAS
jgi:hypothetical protein